MGHSTSDDIAIRVESLVKRYGEAEAVRGVSFTVRRGEVFSLLGPNGAGKTTTIEILEGHRPRTRGTVEVLGYDPGVGGVAFRERVGIVLQEAGIDADLTVSEALQLFAGFYPHPLPVGAALELAGLQVKQRARIGTLSGGQRRRLDLALGLIGDPDLLFLDEPTTGFDPTARRQAWSTLRDLVALDKTIVLTSHYMDEIQELADRVAVMVAGRVVAEGAPLSLGVRDSAEAVVRFRRRSDRDAPALRALVLAGGDTIEIEGDEVTIRSRTVTRLLGRLIAWAGDDELDGLTIARPTLEDVYLRLTGTASPGGPTP